MAPRLSQRLAKKEEAMIQEAIAKSAAGGATTSLSTDAGAQNSTNNVDSISPSEPVAEAVATASDNLNLQEHTGLEMGAAMQNLTEGTSIANSGPSMENSNTLVPVLPAETVVTSSTTVLDGPNLTDAAAAPMIDGQEPSIVTTRKRKAERIITQERRVMPKRLAATKAAGSYAMDTNIVEDGAESPQPAQTYSGRPKRKRADRSLATIASASGSQDAVLDDSDQSEAVKTSPKKRKSKTSVKSERMKPAVRNTRSASKNNILAVPVADDDENDEDFSPDSRRSKEKQAAENKLDKTNTAKTAKTGKASETGKTTETGKTPKKVVRITGEFTNKFKVKLGFTPFPKNTRPSRQSCHDVFDILKKHHERDSIKLERYADDANSVPNTGAQGPMHAGQDVIFHAIVKTILSQATNNENALTVELSLIHRFRYDFLGCKVKGTSPNYHMLRKAPHAAIAKALAAGGLHNMKAKQILACLNYVHARNMELATEEQRLEAEQIENGEKTDFIPGMLSLDYMKSMSMQEKFDHLVSMPGVGPKTAACILCFNFEDPVFAVDTHVFRLSKMLRWLPLNTTNRIHAFMHLDKRVPDELKYGLHQAFWHHGQGCIRCRAGTDQNTKGWNEMVCPIEHLVDRALKDPVKIKKPKQENDEDGEKPKKPKQVKKRPTVYPHSKLTAEEAKELGYELRTITVDDGYGVRRANVTGKVLLKWVLMSDRDAIEHTDRKATAEDMREEISGAEEEGELSDEE
ncbi:hypothetical protein EPUS_05269 [Endocarpon pusillum Z07020]|uniref:HhH-GPD domain-containing protein n=1 Tax=Endocarpon pusillum (strain Z07020 / HMAS-L-300199) TaxID=1263415 RepID=U1G882_ENDPU|nr:uncharacterized protein EPUS_05269 [Endocarpon pusillum Z07020]ERF68188.1 hypothetical protein EPUS_05269 [Endocarpon pusillum Z07020]